MQDEAALLKEQIFTIKDSAFEDLALQIFHFQAINNSVYKEYINYLKVYPKSVKKLTQIPFLPIEFFKSHKVISKKVLPEIIFTSSGTTGSSTSRHLVADLDLYKNSFNKAFQLFYGNPEDYVILALLPSYLERSGSSLIYMVESLIKQSNDKRSNFYLYGHDDLHQLLLLLQGQQKKILLIGVSFALLDFAEKYPFPLKNTIVMETGGMKGRRKELIREELHNILKAAFAVDEIHSEYGMTELLSQAYSKRWGEFNTPPWMKILIRDINDPFDISSSAGASGGINVIDLANIYSCSFIATSDLGKIYKNDSFNVLGRIDNSDIRGCNLLI